MKKFLLLFLLIFSGLYAFSQAGDCPAELLCADNNSATVSNGSVNELSGVNGCLAVNEANGSYWFQLCVNSTGTIAFSINPNGAGNDYDFAVYGPGASCPPTSNPIRCSFAATPVGGGPNGDMTGLGNGAVDNSEGAGGNGWVAPINATAGQCYIISVNNYAGGSSSFVLDLTGTAGYSCSVLPIELLSFEGFPNDGYNLLKWSTASEINNNYFFIEKSENGIQWKQIYKVDGAGNSSIQLDYEFKDMNPSGLIYYRLTQVDYDGKSKTFYPIAVKNASYEKTIIRVTNLMGQDVDENYDGIKIVYYSDGTTSKKVGK